MERCLLEATFAVERLPCIPEAVVCRASLTVLRSLFLCRMTFKLQAACGRRGFYLAVSAVWGLV
jgi:hypothetical protein